MQLACKMNTMIYTKGDDPSFDDLIMEGVVLDTSGHVPHKVDLHEASSVFDVTHVASGRGLYRAWISNLQKAIRRGRVRDALRSAYEVGSMGGQFLTHLVNRFCKVIVSEDIGPAVQSDLLFDVALFVMKYERKKCSQAHICAREVLEGLFPLISRACLGYKSRLSETLHLSHKVIRAMEIHGCELDFAQLFSTFVACLTSRDWSGSITWALWISSYKKRPSEHITFFRDIPYMFAPKRMSGAVYALWNYLCSRKAFHMLTAKRANEAIRRNVALYIIWYHNKGNERKLQICNAVMNVLLQNEITDAQPALSHDELSQLPSYTYEDVSSWDDVVPMSASYDKHVTRWRSSYRNSLHFFYRYGVKVDRLHPLFKEVDEELYRRLLAETL